MGGFLRQFRPGILLLFWALVPVPGQAHAGQEINLERVGGEGLTNLYIKCITQDSRGYMWFGTEEGLFRYDGYQFLPLKNFPGDLHTLSNNNIESLFPGPNGVLWVGTRGGLSRVDCASLAVTNYPEGQIFTVYSILPHTDSSFFIGTSSGLFEFKQNGQHWSRPPGFPANTFIRSLSYDGRENLVAATHQGIYWYHIQSTVCRHFEIPVPAGQKDHIQQIAHRVIPAKGGGLWITTWNAGLLRFDPSNGKFETFTTPNLDKSLEQYRGGYDLFQDVQGKVWVANSENGISIFDPGVGDPRSFFIPWGEERKIAVRVYALFKDKTGICWVGTENGVFKYNPQQEQFRKLDYIPNPLGRKLRPDFSAICSLKDRQGYWWLGAYEGLFLLDPITGILTDYSAAAGIPPGTNVFNLMEDSAGNLWCTNKNRLVFLQKTRRGGHLYFKSQAYALPGPPTNIQIFYLDRQGRIWLGTHDGGVFMFDSSTRNFTSFPSHDPAIETQNHPIGCIFELRDGSILVGGEKLGLLRLDPPLHSYQRIQAFSRTKDGNLLTVNTVSRDGEGNLWIGTEGDGLWRASETFDHTRQYTFRDGLPSMNIINLMADENDHIWILTEGGVVDFRPKRNRYNILDRNAGFRNLYSLSFITKVARDTIAVGDMGCIHFYNSNHLGHSTTPPIVLISGLKIFDHPYPIPEKAAIELDYDQNYFSFEYVALDYADPALNRYSYMLEGLDTKWNEAGSRRFASYTNLREGDYIFRVKACNGDGVWNVIPAALHLTIRPPFWHRWWFYGIVALFGLLLIFSILAIRHRQRMVKEQLRNKIARDLHDDIGSTLSGINIFSKLALMKLPGSPQESSALLQKITSRTEKTMEALSDIVWSINTRKDNLDNVLSRMREYLGEVIEPLGIRYEFLVEEGISQVHIGMDIRKEIYLIFKEAVHNTSKYSGCSHLNIKLLKTKKSLCLEMEDNGKGFDLQTVVYGNGIYNMQERAKKVGGELWINSQIGKGTRIRLEFPLT